MTVPRRRVNGDGSLTRRADGRWMGRYYAWTSSGIRKRVTVYGKTRQQAAERIARRRNATSEAFRCQTAPGNWRSGWTTG
jgi:hypothetical protein